MSSKHGYVSNSIYGTKVCCLLVYFIQYLIFYIKMTLKNTLLKVKSWTQMESQINWSFFWRDPSLSQPPRPQTGFMIWGRVHVSCTSFRREGLWAEGDSDRIKGTMPFYCCFKARWLLDHVRVSFDLMRGGYSFPHETVLSLVTDKQVSPKSGTLKSPPKGFDTSAISKTYYNLVRICSGVLVFCCFSCLHHVHVEPVSPLSSRCYRTS